MKTIEQLTSAYEKGMLQDAIVLWRWLTKNGHGMEDVEKYLSNLAKAAPKGNNGDQAGTVTMKCPECQGPRDQVDGNYQSQWA